MTPSQQHSPAYVWFLATVAALGGLLFGYDWVVIGGAKPFYEIHFGLSSPSQQGWAMSCALVGCLLGAMASGVLSDRLGRKPSLLAAALLFTATSIGTGLAASFAGFVAWRIAGGVAIGLASSLSPMYIAEISPAALRGKLVCINELTIVVGILMAQIANWLIAKPIPAGSAAADLLGSWNAQQGWRWMFAVTAIPSTIFLLGMLVAPESPRWLALKARTADARRILVRIGGEANADEVFRDIAANASAAAPERSELRALMGRRLRRVLLLGVALAVLQQWCGINIIFNYAQEIFSAAGYGLSSILFNIVVTGVTMVLFTLLAIATIDRYGRRVLMLGGCAGLASIYCALGWLYSIHSRGLHMLLLIVAALACYALTLAPVTWVILSEIFPSRARGAAMAISTMSLWAACFVLTYTFPLLNQGIGTARTFWIYAAVCALGFIFIWRKLPETKGRTLEEIERAWE